MATITQSPELVIIRLVDSLDWDDTLDHYLIAEKDLKKFQQCIDTVREIPDYTMENLETELEKQGIQLLPHSVEEIEF